jgi:hypothetical protein
LRGQEDALFDVIVDNAKKLEQLTNSLIIDWGFVLFIFYYLSILCLDKFIDKERNVLLRSFLLVLAFNKSKNEPCWHTTS